MNSLLKCVSIICCAALLSLCVYGCKQSESISPREINNNDKDFELLLESSSFDYENAFTDRDVSAKYDENIYNINLEDDNSRCDNPKTVVNNDVITITNTGTYIIKGELSDGQIVVDADATDKIQLVLDNVSISNDSSSAIKIIQAKKVFVTLADDSSNVLTSPGEFVKTENDKADGVIYSKEKLTLNGNGKLIVNSPSGHGIVCNDDLVVTDGDYIIEAGKNAVKAEDSICISGGALDLTCVKDALHCDNDEDTAKGNIYIKNVQLSISAEDDAIYSSGFIIIDDGNINIPACYEGIEAQKIEINGGEISIKSSDDGINASSSAVDEDNQTEQNPQFNKESFIEGDENCYINITGGNIVIDADGDGIDSNGYLLQSGGNVIVYGPENSGDSALDYDLQAKITGGIITAFGYSAMAQGYNSYSTQGTMLVSFDSETSESLVLTDSDNITIMERDVKKKYNSVVISSPDITVGNTYIIKAGDQTKTIELTDISYSDRMMNDNDGRRNDEAGNPPSDFSDMDDKRGFRGQPEMNSADDFR